jgi:hypothetical protein
MEAVPHQQHDPPPDVVIPPCTSAVLGTNSADLRVPVRLTGRANATGTSE